MTDIYTLGIKADTRDIDRGKTSLDKFGKSADAAGKKTQQIRDNVNMAGKAIATFGVAATAAMGALAVKAGNAAKEIQILASVSGMNAEGFQKAAFAAQRYGIEQEKLADIFKDTQDKIGDFLATEGGELVNFFEKVAPLAGVTKESFRGLSGQEGLQLYVDSLEKANVGQEEMVFFLEAIANDSTKLLPLLRDNGAEFELLGTKAERLGIILDNLDLENLSEMNRALNDLSAVATASGNVIGATLAPFITDLSNEFLASAGSADKLRDATISMAGVGVTVAGVFADAARVFEIFGKSIGAVIFTQVEFSRTMGIAFKDVFNLLLEDGPAAFKLFGLTVGKTIRETANKLISGIELGINKAIQVVVSGINKLAEFGEPLLDKLGIKISKLTGMKIELPRIDSTVFDQAISEINLDTTQLSSGITAGFQNIENAWADVHEALLEPIPSEGFDDWFEKLKEGIELARKLKDETESSTGGQTETIKKLGKTWGGMLSDTGQGVNALSTIFSGNEKAQKSLRAVSQAIAAAEAIETIRKITMGTAEASAHVANEGVKASANATTAVTSAFAAPFPTNFIAGAAMIGIMASIVGGFSGGGTFTDPTEGRQDEQGTGSVLGSSDKSASISKAQDRFEDIQIDQLVELRGIRSGLNNIGNGIAQVTKGLITSAAGEFGGYTGKTSGFAGFNSSRTDLIDSGIMFVEQTLGQIIEQGTIGAREYFDTKTKDSSWWGLSSSTSFDTAFEALGSGLNQQIGGIFQDIGKVVLESAQSLGFETVEVTTTELRRGFDNLDPNDIMYGIGSFFEMITNTTEMSLEDALNTFNVDIGRISLEGLSGEEIQAELEAVFSQQADLIAEYLVPSITEYQQVGEGAFDTLLRVTQEQAVFNDALSVMGMSLADLSNVMQIDVAQGIIEMVGGAERFGTLTQSFFNDFFSEAEQFDVLAGSIADVFGQLGVSVSDSRDAFRELVESQDLTTEAGRQLFSTLLEIAPAMDEYFDTLEERAEDELALAERVANEAIRAKEKEARELEKINQEITRNAEKAAREAERVAAEGENLELRLLQLQGTELEYLAEVRQRELDSVDESNRAILEAIYAEEDLARQRADTASATQQAAEAAQQLADSLRAAATDNINNAGSMLSQSIGLEKDRLQAVLDMGKEAYKLEDERLRAEVSAINEAKNARLKALSAERGAVEKNMQYLLGIASKFNQSSSASVGVDDALNAAKRGDFSLADQLKVKQLDAGSFGSASEYNIAQALQDNKLQAISGLATNAANRAGSQLSRIDRQIRQDSAFYDDQLTKLDLLIASNEETLQEYQDSYDEQIENLQKIEAAAEDQLNALLGIDGSVLSVYEAIKQLAEMPGISGKTDNTAAQLLELSKEAKAAQASIAKTSAATAAILQRLELGGLDTRVLS